MEEKSNHQKHNKRKTRAPYENCRNGGKRNIKKRNREPDKKSADELHEESKGITQYRLISHLTLLPAHPTLKFPTP